MRRLLIKKPSIEIIDSIVDEDGSDALLVAVEQLRLLALARLERDSLGMFEVQPKF